jgi:hypothetical protein
MKLDVLDVEGAIDLIADEFRIGQAPHAIRAAIICEHIRAIVLMGTAAEDGHPVSKLRVERTAYQRVAPLLKSVGVDIDLAKVIKTEVRHLAKLRDLVETPLGLTIAAPRLIPLDERTCMLIGGGPSQSLPWEIRSSLQIAARARIVSISAKNRTLLDILPWQSQKDWLATSVGDPVAWSVALKREARTKMVAADEVEYPEVLENGFWSKLGKVRGLQDISLIRYKQGEFPRYIYALATITASVLGEARVSRMFELEYDDARRFQGCSPKNGRQMELQYVHRGEFVGVEVGHPLARPECLFLSLGSFTLCKAHYDWPRHYWFPLSVLPLLEVAASSLGFALTEVPTLRKKNENH